MFYLAIYIIISRKLPLKIKKRAFPFPVSGYLNSYQFINYNQIWLHEVQWCKISKSSLIKLALPLYIVATIFLWLRISRCIVGVDLTLSTGHIWKEINTLLFTERILGEIATIWSSPIIIIFNSETVSQWNNSVIMIKVSGSQNSKGWDLWSQE